MHWEGEEQKLSYTSDFRRRTCDSGTSMTELVIHTLARLAIFFTPDTLVVLMGREAQTAVTSPIRAVVQGH